MNFLMTLFWFVTLNSLSDDLFSRHSATSSSFLWASLASSFWSDLSLHHYTDI